MDLSKFEPLYFLLPDFLQDKICNVVAEKFADRKFKNFDKYFKISLLNEWSGVNVLERIRYMRRLWKEIPFYKTYPKKFAEMPILTREDIRYNFKNLLNKNYKYDIMHTSGTTGTGIQIAWANPTAYQMEYATVWRQRNRAGIKRNERSCQFGGAKIISVKRKKPPFYRYLKAENIYYFSMYHLSEENLPEYVREIKEINPVFIQGYPSLLNVIARYILENDIEVQTKAIFTSSDTLLDPFRRNIEEAFNCKCYDKYGNTELAGSICECDEGGLHIDTDYGLIEFLDENNDPVSYGESGRMICTNFINPAMPLIRYDTGDRAVPIDDVCSCGRKLPLVKEIEGRVDDVIIATNGAYVTRMDHVFKSMYNIFEAQIIQVKRDLIKVNIVPRETYTERDEKQLIYEIQSRLGKDMRIKINKKNRIKRINGKFPAVVNKCLQ